MFISLANGKERVIFEKELFINPVKLQCSILE